MKIVRLHVDVGDGTGGSPLHEKTRSDQVVTPGVSKINRYVAG
jgi:hypothetical protein